MSVTLLEIRGLSIDKTHDPLITNATFKIFAGSPSCAGEIVLIQGANGSGKSSIFKSLLTRQNPFRKPFNSLFNMKKKGQRNQDLTWDKEYFSFNGVEIKTQDDYTWFKSQISYVEQTDDQWTARTPRELFNQTNHLSHQPLTKDALDLKITSLLTYFGLDTEILNRRLTSSKLSGGEKRLIRIINGFIPNVEFYMFDEPINNLDFAKAYKFSEYLETLTQQGKSILLITHCRLFLPPINRSYQIRHQSLIQNTRPVEPCRLSNDGDLECDSMPVMSHG